MQKRSISNPSIPYNTYQLWSYISPSKSHIPGTPPCIPQPRPSPGHSCPCTKGQTCSKDTLYCARSLSSFPFLLQALEDLEKKSHHLVHTYYHQTTVTHPLMVFHHILFSFHSLKQHCTTK